MRATALALLASALVVGTDATAQESDADSLEWRWRTFGPAEYAVTGGALGVAVTALVLAPDERSRSQRRIGLDENVRDSLRLDDRSARLRARQASDYLMFSSLAYPYVADSFFNAGIYRRSPQTAAQLALVATEVYAVTLMGQTVVKVTVGRERPLARECGRSLDADTGQCASKNRYQSFFSGHTSMTFAAAGVTCMNHAYVPLHGGGAAEAVPCASLLLAASATGALRIMGDKHFFTDVVAGAGWGLGVGLTLPWLLHYRHSRPSEGETTSRVQWQLLPSLLGAQVVGTF